MFFQKAYAKPGPGVRPDEPEKTGWNRFAEILTIECGSLIKLNLLFLLSCVPVVTIPAALYAMHIVVRRMVCDETVDCFYHYKQAFRGNWKKAYAAFFAVVLPLVVAACGMMTYLRFAVGNPMFFLPFMFCSTIFLIALLSSMYFYAFLSTGKTVREALRPAIVLGIGRPARALLAALSTYGLTFAALMVFPISLIYFLLIGFTAPCLLANFFIRTVLKQYASI